MTNHRAAVQLLLKGWDEADQKKDFGYLIPTVMYAKKQNVDKSWFYLSVIFSTDGQFLEAVLETFIGQKNTRDKGQRPKSVQILRGNELSQVL
jgi:hypothetical protein